MKLKIKGCRMYPAHNNTECFHLLRTCKVRGVLIICGEEATYVMSDYISDIKCEMRPVRGTVSITETYLNGMICKSQYSADKFFIACSDWRE